MNRPIRTGKSVAKLNWSTFRWLRHFEPLACNIKSDTSINTYAGYFIMSIAESEVPAGKTLLGLFLVKGPNNLIGPC